MEQEEIDRELEDIFLNESSMMHKAYFKADHPLHEKSVERVETLSRLKFGDEPFAPEVMPVVSRPDFLKPKE